VKEAIKFTLFTQLIAAIFIWLLFRAEHPNFTLMQYFTVTYGIYLIVIPVLSFFKYLELKLGTSGNIL